MTKHRGIALLLLLCELVSFATAEPVCPLDYSLVKVRDGSEAASRRVLQDTNPPITIIRQTTKEVQFVVKSTTTYGDTESFAPEDIFVSYEKDAFGSEECTNYPNLGPPDVPDSSTDIITAHCYSIPDRGSFALVRVYARSFNALDLGSVAIPQCCNDPQAESGLPFSSVEYIYEIRCQPTCDNPDEYVPPPTDPPEPEPLCVSDPAIDTHDIVMGSQLNGPHFGSRHPWAWVTTSTSSCSRYAGPFASGSNAWPCALEALENNGFNDRILNFDSSYMNFQFKIDQGMEANITLPDGTSRSFYPSGIDAGGAPVTCSKPSGGNNWQEYPLRLVSSGKHFHHWYAQDLTCAAVPSRIEFKVSAECVEFYTVSANTAATSADNQPLQWSENGQARGLSGTEGYAHAAFCVECTDEASLSGCAIVEKSLPTDCCPLHPLGRRDPDASMCGTAWPHSPTRCGADKLTTTTMTEQVSLTSLSGHAVRAEGTQFLVNVPRGSGSQLVNLESSVAITNSSPEFKKVKINFHIEWPRRHTGAAGILVDTGTNKITGIHVAMSKNWHLNRAALYDEYWWNGIAHFRVPPGETGLKLIVAYQYYRGLHGVSHSQLSLLGWAVNGLWEETGIGANGESITFEPHGHHRRQMVLDTRPFLVCQLDTNCDGSANATQWTENHGGSDFLVAINNQGKYQYLVEDTSFHTMNGPRLSNATFSGITADRKISVSRTVSTHTADDFVRHLHSFRYEFLTDVDAGHYPRFAWYTLGGDNYNYVKYPHFAYGSGNLHGPLSGTTDATIPTQPLIDAVTQFRYVDGYYGVDAPVGCSNQAGSSDSCWFAMMTDPTRQLHHRANRGLIVRNFRGRINGQTWPPPDRDVSAFSFNILDTRDSGGANQAPTLELGLPNELKNSAFLQGDYLEADLELILPPRQNPDYNGDSARLRTWLNDAGVDTDWTNGWKVVAREATIGDQIETTVFKGELERVYHPRVHVNCDNEAQFNIYIPPNSIGILPITIAGVGEITGPLDTPDEILYRYYDGQWQQMTKGLSEFQVDRDVLDNSYSFVYSLGLEFTGDSSQFPVDPAGDCVQFFFGLSPPVDANPSC